MSTQLINSFILVADIILTKINKLFLLGLV